MPMNPDDAAQFVKRRHPVWTEMQKDWRWLFDSLEGGTRYRHADYFRGPFEPWRDPLYAFGWDAPTGEGFPFTYDMVVQRNLTPHKSEMGADNRDLYTLRLHRTPVPALVELVTRRYLSRIYSQPISRKGPKALGPWWEDVDGKGSKVGQWFRKKIGPMLLSLGQIDLVFGRPEADDEQLEQIRTRADVLRFGLDRCVASYILPENMVWWRTNRADQYVECLVHERADDGSTVWRHWDKDEANAYTGEGEHVPEKSFVHGTGCVPIVRVYDEMSLRLPHCGRSRMWTIADLQKSIYNRKSELVLNDVQQTHAVLSGPEDYFQADAAMPVGPQGALPKKKFRDGSGYENWEWLVPPKAGVEACRLHMMDDQDEVHLDAGLLKPAGLTSGKTVGQSGVSKAFDEREGNDLLSEVAQTLAEAETQAARMALRVLGVAEGPAGGDDQVVVEYPREYDLFTANDLAVVLGDIQLIASSLGTLPQTEGEVLARLVKVLLPGISDERLAELQAEVKAAAVQGGADRDAAREGRQTSSSATGNDNLGVEDQNAGEAPGGTTQNATEDPSITLPPDAAMAVQALNAIIAPELV